MDRCPLCKGEKNHGITTYSADLGFGVVVVRDVPARICNQCGEEWIEPNVAEELERIVNTARHARCQVEVVSFQPAV
ncbi:MAG: type II toxin-antitoxin system MqsA family antitoxin [Deltaproteobacteria bacterium]|nr:type II toxin-antitoxin system MqsA family antitoxin [Deltaproteobacteria bacterium]